MNQNKLSISRVRDVLLFEQPNVRELSERRKVDRDFADTIDNYAHDIWVRAFIKSFEENGNLVNNPVFLRKLSEHLDEVENLSCEDGLALLKLGCLHMNPSLIEYALQVTCDESSNSLFGYYTAFFRGNAHLHWKEIGDLVKEYGSPQAKKAFVLAVKRLAPEQSFPNSGLIDLAYLDSF